MKLSYAREIGDDHAVTDHRAKLAADAAFLAYPTPELDDQERGAWIADTIEAALRFLRDPLRLPLPAEAAAEQAILFWYLAVCETRSPGEIGRTLHKYVSGVRSKDPEQWVTSRMWLYTRVPSAKAGAGLDALVRHGRLRLAAGDPTAVQTDAVQSLVSESVDMLMETEPATASWAIVLAHFAANPVPVVLLAEAVAPDLPHVAAQIHRLPLQEHVARLATAGLLIGDDISFAVSPVVAAAVLGHVTPSLRDKALRAAIQLIDEGFPPDCEDQRTWARCETFLPHLLAIAAAAERLPQARQESCVLYERASIYHRVRARSDDAVALGRHAVEIGESVVGSKSPWLAPPLVNLAHAHMDRTEYVEAEKLLRRGIGLEQDSRSTDPEKLARTLNLYGNLLRRMSRHGEAEVVQRQALALFQSDRRPPPYWEISNDLALTLRWQGRMTEAMSLFDEVLDHLEGRDSARAVRRNIATLHVRLGQHEQAKEILEELLDEQQSREAADKGFIAELAHDLAGVYRALHDDRAAAMYEYATTVGVPWVS